MPADVLRDKEIGIPAPPTAEAPKPTPAPPLAGYARVYQQEIEKLTPKYEAAEKAAREDLERRKQEIADYKQRVLSSPLAPAPPALPSEPVAPVISARPFLDAGPGEPWQQSVQKLMMGMGLMAQMGIGIKGGFPGGALAAYTGALNGWAEGDHIRAANEWKTYMGQLQQYDRSVGRVQQDFENAMRTWGHDQDRLKTEFGILAAEHGLSREGIEMAFREPDRMMQQLTTSVKIMETMQRDADSLAFRNLMALHKIQADKDMLEYRKSHDAEIQADRRERQDEALQQPAPGGPYFDRKAQFDPQTGDFTTAPIASPTKAEYAADPGRYGKANTQSQLLMEMLPTAIPNINRLKQLSSKVLAKYGPENIIRGLEGRANQAMMADPDWADFDTLTTDTNIELAAALSRGQLRVQLLTELQRSSAVNPRMTQAVADRRLELVRQQIANRVYGMLGAPLKPMPGSSPTEAPGLGFPGDWVR